MTINIYFKRKNFYEKIARIDKSSGPITGSIWYPFPVQYHKGIKDIHFTYPADGQYHITVIFNDKTELKVFSDRASIKIVGGTEWDKTSKEVAQKMVPMTMLIPDFAPSPLADYLTMSKSFPILMMGISRVDGSDTLVPKREDFVIDCTDVDMSRTPNLNLMIIGKDVNPTAPWGLGFIDKKVFFNTHPKVFAGMFYGK